MSHHNQHAHAFTEIIVALVTPEGHDLLLLSFIVAKLSLGFIITCRDPSVMQEHEMVFHQFVHA